MVEGGSARVLLSVEAGARKVASVLSASMTRTSGDAGRACSWEQGKAIRGG